MIDVIVIVGHAMSYGLVSKYHRIKQSFAAYGDVKLLHNGVDIMHLLIYPISKLREWIVPLIIKLGNTN